MRGVAALFLAGFAALACDPVLEVCVKVVRCDDEEPLVGAHVVIDEFFADMYTEPNGVACHVEVGELEKPFDVEVDKPGYVAKTERSPDPPDGSVNLDMTVCLEEAADE